MLKIATRGMIKYPLFICQLLTRVSLVGPCIAADVVQRGAPIEITSAVSSIPSAHVRSYPSASKIPHRVGILVEATRRTAISLSPSLMPP